MYCIRLIKKSVSETDKNGKIIYDDFVTATHLKITKEKLFFYDPVTPNSEQDFYDINSYSYIFINHYLNYTIKELEEAYEKIIKAYATLSQSSSYHRDFDNIISIFELVDTMFSLKEKRIIDEVAEKNKSKINSLLHNKNKQKKETANSDLKKTKKVKNPQGNVANKSEANPLEDDGYKENETINNDDINNTNEKEVNED